MPTTDYMAIFGRHRGPYTLCVLRPGGKSGRTQFLSGRIIKGEDVIAESLALIRDPRDGITNVSVWSETEQQFVTTFRREDANYEANLSRAARAGRYNAEPRIEDDRDPAPADDGPRDQDPVAVDAGDERGGAAVPREPPAHGGGRRASVPGPAVAAAVVDLLNNKPAARRAGTVYAVVDGADPGKLGTSAQRIWESFKRKGRATVDDVAAEVDDLATGKTSPKALVASYATKFKAAGWLAKEER
jgi:hypothetical protein